MWSMSTGGSSVERLHTHSNSSAIQAGMTIPHCKDFGALRALHMSNEVCRSGIRSEPYQQAVVGSVTK